VAHFFVRGFLRIVIWHVGATRLVVGCLAGFCARPASGFKARQHGTGKRYPPQKLEWFKSDMLAIGNVMLVWRRWRARSIPVKMFP
jgi:hypothetical protein